MAPFFSCFRSKLVILVLVAFAVRINMLSILASSPSLLSFPPPSEGAWYSLKTRDWGSVRHALFRNIKNPLPYSTAKKCYISLSWKYSSEGGRGKFRKRKQIGLTNLSKGFPILLRLDPKINTLIETRPSRRTASVCVNIWGHLREALQYYIPRLMLTVKDRAKPVVERATRIVKHKSRYRMGLCGGEEAAC